MVTKEHVLDALYQRLGEYMALAERTSHNTRIDTRNKAKGCMEAIRIVEGFDW